MEMKKKLLPATVAALGVLASAAPAFADVASATTDVASINTAISGLGTALATVGGAVIGVVMVRKAWSIGSRFVSGFTSGR